MEGIDICLPVCSVFLKVNLLFMLGNLESSMFICFNLSVCNIA